MPAVDQCQPQVINALQKEGWKLESAPLKLDFGTKFVYVDLAMSRGVNGSSQTIMLVEVKCFPNTQSITHDLYGAIGQFIIYRAMIEKNDFVYPLFLTVPLPIYEFLFDEIVHHAIVSNHINLVVIDIEQEKVSQWIKH